ncbi:MAG: PTS glucitol/sorbitol transporter subunit IIA [Anaerolineales bacterium]|nr:PTS glucitol/sorbitol transporter subunit IIA [Anaerolineales bacterium]MBX3005686.1 PTS glucitol/sorbitol transporter subunit IIA [Anaerolineales bacterium]MCW5839231.1 PTS glucitol/sorbitol transporter subunit IIA [Anaerolineales bacterium]MCW5888323.1 PTS glucitol/sorbitol transporter subunit IIA [Anaerolineales bacterium]
MVKYQARVTHIGPYVAEFIAENVLVFFGGQAPEELAEFAILHDGQQLEGQVMAGDRLFLNDEAFQVLAVGEVANANLASLGHLVVKVNGQPEPEMPGDVCVEMKALPTIEVGTQLRIEDPE